MSKPTLEVTDDFTDDFNDVINKFKNDNVLVGIPAEKTARTDDGKDVINNATILAINNFGSEEANIKPWPVMEIGIKAAQDDIAKQFKVAAQNAFKQGIGALNQYYERAGIIASNSIKKVINAQIELPSERPSEATLAARERAGFKGTKALIVTGQVRNAITYVVKRKGI